MDPTDIHCIFTNTFQAELKVETLKQKLRQDSSRPAYWISQFLKVMVITGHLEKKSVEKKDTLQTPSYGSEKPPVCRAPGSLCHPLPCYLGV